MPRFFIATNLVEDSEISLPSQVIQHILVLRLKVGDTIELFNGNNKAYSAKITAINRKQVLVRVMQQQQQLAPPKVAIDLYISIIANDKMDLAIQKATELGVKNIYPLITSRSQRIHADKIFSRIKHWQQIIHSSCEQSGNNLIPIINQPLNFANLIADNSGATKIILLPNNNIDINCIKKDITAVKLLVGPEGGFSIDEINTALTNGFQPLQLGNLVLRAETAVIAGISFIHTYYGQWQKI